MLVSEPLFRTPSIDLLFFYSVERNINSECHICQYIIMDLFCLAILEVAVEHSPDDNACIVDDGSSTDDSHLAAPVNLDLLPEGLGLKLEHDSLEEQLREVEDLNLWKVVEVNDIELFR